MKKLDVNDLV